MNPGEQEKIVAAMKPVYDKYIKTDRQKALLKAIQDLK